MKPTRKLSTITILVCLLLTCASALCAAEYSEGAVLRVGSSFNIPATDEHMGNIYVFGGNVEIAGVLKGRALVIGGILKVNGYINGDIIALGGRVALGDGAKVDGNIAAAGGGIDRGAHVEVRGEVNSISLSQGLHAPQFHWFPFNLKAFPIYSLYLLGLYLMAIIISYVFREQAATTEAALAAYPGRSLLIGFLILLLLLPVTVVLVLTVVGLPIAYLIWLCFFIARLLGYVVVADFSGKRILGHLGHGTPQLLHLALGIIILGALRAIPFIGFVFGWLVAAVGLGAVSISKFGVVGRWWPFGKKKQATSEE